MVAQVVGPMAVQTLGRHWAIDLAFLLEGVACFLGQLRRLAQGQHQAGVLFLLWLLIVRGVFWLLICGYLQVFHLGQGLIGCSAAEHQCRGDVRCSAKANISNCLPEKRALTALNL